ncbi:MAG TPA: hypothetical protein GX521_03655 [Firmicutes bacterium]|nr:hypothetical protein [Bacillota bacterium]
MENILFFFARLPVYSYGFMLGLGLLLGSCLALREAKRKGLGGDFVYQFIVRAVLAFIIAGRIGFVFAIYGWRTFIYPWVLLSDIHLDEARGLMGLSIYVLYFLLRRVDNPAAFLDALIPSAALMQSLGCLGSSVLGRETTVRWGVDLGEFLLHPLPLYSALAYYLLFALLWRCRRTLRYDGQLFLGYLALSAVIERMLMPFQEVLGDSANPWLYSLAALLFGGAWFYVYISSPLTDARRRRGAIGWRSLVLYAVSLLGVGLVMIKFFYWRFS